MGKTLSLVYTHLIFSTKNREPSLGEELRERLWRYLGGICNDMDCPPVQIGGTADHIHILCILSRECSLGELVKVLKSKSSSWIKSLAPEYSNFFWQTGYGVFSVNPQEKKIVTEYIRNQAEHHKKRSFRKNFWFF